MRDLGPQDHTFQARKSSCFRWGKLHHPQFTVVGLRGPDRGSDACNLTQLVGGQLRSPDSSHSGCHGHVQGAVGCSLLDPVPVSGTALRKSLALQKWQHLLLPPNPSRGNGASDLPNGALTHLSQRHRLHETHAGKSRFCIQEEPVDGTLSTLKCTIHSHPIFRISCPVI